MPASSPAKSDHPIAIPYKSQRSKLNKGRSQLQEKEPLAKKRPSKPHTEKRLQKAIFERAAGRRRLQAEESHPHLTLSRPSHHFYPHHTPTKTKNKTSTTENQARSQPPSSSPTAARSHYQQPRISHPDWDGNSPNQLPKPTEPISSTWTNRERQPLVGSPLRHRNILMLPTTSNIIALPTVPA